VWSVRVWGGSGGISAIGYREATPNPTTAQNSSGIFAYQRSFGVQDVTDGTSNTVALSESIADNPQTGTSQSLWKGTGGAGNLKAVYQLDVNTVGLALVQTDIAACT